MSTSKSNKSKRAKLEDTQNHETATVSGNEAPEAAGSPTRSAKRGREGVRIVSVACPAKLARQLKLLSSVTGEPISAIVISAVGRVVSKRLPDALAEIAKADANGDE